MTLEGELKIRLEMAGDGFEITSEDVAISPYHLLAGSLASCIVLLIQPWAERSGIDLGRSSSTSVGSTWAREIIG